MATAQPLNSSPLPRSSSLRSIQNKLKRVINGIKPSKIKRNSTNEVIFNQRHSHPSQFSESNSIANKQSYEDGKVVTSPDIFQPIIVEPLKLERKKLELLPEINIVPLQVEFDVNANFVNCKANALRQISFHHDNSVIKDTDSEEIPGLEEIEEITVKQDILDYYNSVPNRSTTPQLEQNFILTKKGNKAVTFYNNHLSPVKEEFLPLRPTNLRRSYKPEKSAIIDGEIFRAPGSYDTDTVKSEVNDVI